MAPHSARVDRTGKEPPVTNVASLGLILRFRDFVTEVGGTVSEHRKVLRQYGHVWWGWWYRQSEYIPRRVLASLFSEDASRHVPILLFHSGIFELYSAYATRVVVAPPSIDGISSPDYGTTPDYYLRGRFPAWFRFEQDIVPVQAATVPIVGRPTAGHEADRLPEATATAEEVQLAALGCERPTLWLFESDVKLSRGGAVQKVT